MIVTFPMQITFHKMLLYELALLQIVFITTSIATAVRIAKQTKVRRVQE